MKKIMLFIFSFFLLPHLCYGTTKMEMVVQTPQSHGPNIVEFSPDGSHFITLTSTGKEIKVWNIKGRLVRSITGDKPISLSRVALSYDNRYLAVTHVTTMRIHDLKTGNYFDAPESDPDLHYRQFYAVAFLPDNRIIAGTKIYRHSGAFENALELWNLKAEYISTLGVEDSDPEKYITGIKLFPEGNKFLVTSLFNNTFSIWDLKQNERITVNGSSDYSPSFAFSRNGEFFGWASHVGLVVCNSKGIRVVNAKKSLNAPAMSIDRKMYVTMGFSTQDSSRPVLFLKDLKDRVIRKIENVPSMLLATRFSPDAKHIVAGSMDGSVLLINTETAEFVMLVNDNQEWLTYTADGYWAGSKQGGNLVKMVTDEWQAFAVDQFAAQYNRPDIILKRLGFDDKELLNHYYYHYRKRLRKLGIDEKNFIVDFHVPEVEIIETKEDGKFLTITSKMSDSKYDLLRYNIYVNDVPVFGAYGKGISGKNQVVTEKIELTKGGNKVELTCVNIKGAESFRQLTMAHYTQPVQEDLYFIGFGTSKYKDPAINDLVYAHKDAQDLAELFKSFEKTKYRKVYTHIFTDGQVTIESIKNAKKLLGSARVDDTFVLFIAGHGMHDTDKNSTYYYVTHDALQDNLSARAADFDMIEDLLQGIAPRKKLFLMDTCESGELQEEDPVFLSQVANSRSLKARTLYPPKQRGLRIPVRKV